MLDFLQKENFVVNTLNYYDLHNHILFVFDESQTEIKEYVTNNYDDIRLRFTLKEKVFSPLLEKNHPRDIIKVINYYYPSIQSITVSSFNLANSILKRDSDYIIKDFIGYKGGIKSGFIDIESGVFIEFKDTSVEKFKELLKECLNHFGNYYDFDDMLPGEDFGADENIKVDSVTLKEIEAIEAKFYELKKSGQFLYILPILKKHIEEAENATSTISKLYISEDFKIYLSDYNNLEIKLTPITKAIYLLFLNHPEGILLTELWNYKKELLNLYLKISAKSDYNQITKSIEDVVNTKNNAIYVHLSRIKSAFKKVLSPKYADYYYVDGPKLAPKKISLDDSYIVR